MKGQQFVHTLLLTNLVLQVIALTVRSSGRVDEPELTVAQEMDYPTAINRALPDDIRVLGWAPVEDSFNARYLCALMKETGDALVYASCAQWVCLVFLSVSCRTAYHT